MSSAEFPLSTRQGVIIAGRVLCVFFVFYAIANLLALPGYFVAIVHYRAHGDGAAGASYYTYWLSRYVGWITGSLGRAVVELWLAKWFYQCGPKASGFLLGEDAKPSEPVSASSAAL